jgi:F0F1-type ATP synthase assembly protein I
MINKFSGDIKFKKFILSASLYGGASIFGPILVFVGTGYFLDKHFQTGRLFIFSGLAIAFIFTNVLLYRKAAQLTREMVKLSPPPLSSNETIKPNKH